MPSFWSNTTPGRQRPGGKSWWAVNVVNFNARLLKLTESMSGAYTNDGIVSEILQKVTASLSGVEQPSGSIATQTKPLSAAMIGSQGDTGVIAVSIGGLSSSMVGGSAFTTGAIATATKELQTAMVGAQNPTGVIAAALKATSAAIVAAQTDRGSVSELLHQASAALAGAQAQSGTVTEALHQAIEAMIGFTAPTYTAAASAASTVTLPAHNPGDTIIIGAARANITQATKPTASAGNVPIPAWVDIDAPTGTNGFSIRTAQFVATSNSHTSGTWTNASVMFAIVIQGAASTAVGGHAVSTNASQSNVPAPAVTLTNNDGSSLIFDIHVSAVGFATGGGMTPPTGYTRAASATLIVVNAKNDTTSDGAVTQAASSSLSTQSAGATIEIRAH